MYLIRFLNKFGIVGSKSVAICDLSALLTTLAPKMIVWGLCKLAMRRADYSDL